MPWRNRQGITTELAREDAPGQPSGLLWRISRATIDKPTPYSAFPGIERVHVLLAGAGFTIEFDDGVDTLNEKFQTLRFAGDRPARCKLLQGPCDVLNILVADSLGSARISVHALHARTGCAPRSMFLAAEGNWSLHLPDAGYHLSEGSLAILTDEQASPVNLIGTGAIIQVDIVS
jgi:environmental stress-induced protein Ves